MNSREPMRWLEPDSEASPELRELLDAARLDEPSPEQLASLAGRMGRLLSPSGSVPSGGTPSSTASTGARTVVASGVKGKVLTGVVVAALAGGGLQAVRVYTQARASAPAVVSPTKARALPEPEPVREAPPPPEPAPPPSPPVPEAKSAAPRARAPRASGTKPATPEVTATATDEELDLLESLYRTFQRGDMEGVLAEAQQHASRFPKGALAQEREVLAIEALVRLGRRSEAEARAENFQRRYPASTHWVRIQRLLSDPRP